MVSPLPNQTPTLLSLALPLYINETSLSLSLSSALAYSLGMAGRRVLVVERDMSTPDRIVGELLQPGGCASLRELGMGDCLEGIDAAAVEGYYVCVSRLSSSLLRQGGVRAWTSSLFPRRETLTNFRSFFFFFLGGTLLVVCL